MSDSCNDASRVVLSVAIAAALLAVVVVGRVLRWVLREARKMRARIDSERAIVADYERRIKDGPGAARQAVQPPAPRP